MRSRAFWMTIALTASLAGLTALPAQTQEATSCVVCHSDADLFDEESLAIVEHVGGGVHVAAGLGCHDCHGGNPAPEAADDLFLAKDEDFAENPYRGAPARGEIPSFCSRCHSDPAYMRRFKPDLRVDQETEYWTSQHGQALAAGNTAVATCTDCHSHHGILAPGNAESPVYPTRVAETCRSCHSDGERIADAALPTDQYARWRQSVHAAALFEKGDFSAPTCNDCHGNHGARPPGIDSIAFVCGQCHGREARLFRASAKHAGFEEHNELMEAAGDEGCAACHEEPEPASALTGERQFTECATCHGHHAVIRPTLAMLSPLPETPCVFCHEGPLAEEVSEPEKAERRYRATKEALLATAGTEGLEGDALFDWLVDQAVGLPVHTHPEFRRLFDKFRIGKTTYTFEDPDGHGRHRVDVVRCNHCHGAEVLLADEPAGYLAAEESLGKMRELTALTARAERVLLTARRGGVETGHVLQEIENAVDAQIGLEVLLHTFGKDEEEGFAGKHREGLESAYAALTAGDEALDELTFRRKGLAVFLAFVVLVAVGLALKIRQLGQ